MLGQTLRSITATVYTAAQTPPAPIGIQVLLPLARQAQSAQHLQTLHHNIPETKTERQQKQQV